MRVRLGGVLAAVAVVAATAGIGRATADTPPYVPWPSLLPPLNRAPAPSTATDCPTGDPACLAVTLAEMGNRFEPQAAACSHHAVFSLAYLRTTEVYEWARDQPGFFADTAFANHEDAVFARYYFDAYDRWAAGNRSAVPQAWLLAFDAGRDRKVSGVANLLLGMNAHVNRDLPYVLADIGLTAPDGTSRKADHDKVNEFLNRVVEPLLAEEAARFDPAADDLSTPYGVGYLGLFQLLAGWREMAWRNAELLVAATTPAARALVASEIEANATLQARLIITTNGYVPPLSTSTARDAFCAANHGAAAPIPYP